MDGSRPPRCYALCSSARRRAAQGLKGLQSGNQPLEINADEGIEWRRNEQPSRKRRLAALAAVVALVGCQPQDETPGLWLRGEPVEERVGDWSFTGDIEEVFIETRSWYGIPHSTTIWCVELAGELYVGSYGDQKKGDQKKAWEKNLARNSEAKLAIAGRLYEVSLVPVTDPGRVEALDDAYTRKYDMADVFGDDLPEWWYYHVTQ